MTPLQRRYRRFDVQKIVLLMVAGAIGTLARYELQGVVQRSTGATFPWGTLAVNVVGCFAFGIIWALAEERLLIRPETRSVVLIGFLGSFTTFSSFVFETTEFLRDSQWWPAVANVLAQNIFGIIFFFAGLLLGRLL
jgi:CrcB protein